MVLLFQGVCLDLIIGQKQRIAIARALLNNPSILLLDEPTSALDPNSSKAIMDTLHSLSLQSNRPTIILVSHHLDTIRCADVIAVMNEGKLEEMGTHFDLIEKRGKYWRMIEMNKLSDSYFVFYYNYFYLFCFLFNDKKLSRDFKC